MRVSIVLAATPGGVAAGRGAAARGRAPRRRPCAAPARAQPPVFGVGVDVVAVDASVVDAEGRPVLGLGPEDFRVEVDGKPRRLVSVEYLGRDLEPPAPPARPPGALQQQRGRAQGPAGPAAGRPRQHRPGRGPRGAEGGRALPRHARPRRPRGARLRAGPRAGHRVHRPTSTDVRRGLKGVVGMADRAGFRVPLAEAVSYIQLNDRIRWEQFLQELCGGYMSETREIITSDRPTAFSQARMEQCNLELENEAALVYRLYRERSLATQCGPPATFRRPRAHRGPEDAGLHLGGPGHGVARRAARPRDRRLAGAATLFVAPPRHLLGGRVVQLLGESPPWRTGRSSRRGSTTSPRRRAGPCCASSARGRPPSSGSRAR